jgi:ABC-type multidrug transport system fused ATPase/permease subunit
MAAARRFIREMRLVGSGGWRRMPVVGTLMFVATGLDLLGVVLIAPFLSLALGSPGSDFTLPPWLRNKGASALGLLGSALLVVFIAKAYAAYRVQRAITRLTEGERARLMTALLAAYQAQPYEAHLRRNSNELITTVVWYTQVFTNGVLASLLRLVTDGLVFLALGAYLAWTDLRAVALLVVLLAAVFWWVSRSIRTRLGRAAHRNAALTAEVSVAVSQALGALREVRILGREAYFRRRMQVAAEGLVDAVATQASLQLVPRQAVEIAVVTFLVVLAWMALRSGGDGLGLVPLLGTFAAAAVRLMPASTSVLSNWNNLRANRFVVTVLAQELAQADSALVPAAPSAASPEPFRKLELDEVDFCYALSEEPVLRRVSLKIEAGEVVGVMGRSGAGKSTLADVILGLLRPQQGQVRVNGWNVHVHLPRWHAMVAYIPQSAYLLDDTLRRNVALGVPDHEIDARRLDDAVLMAQLQELVARLPKGLDTEVGERGVRLSGGQRQRVAIARALYHDRQFLILDEATSALDQETEQDVVDAVNALQGVRTLLIIAHRESTLRAATRIVGLEAGGVGVRVRTPR